MNFTKKCIYCTTFIGLSSFLSAGGGLTPDQEIVENIDLPITEEKEVIESYAFLQFSGGVNMLHIESSIEKGETFNDGALDDSGTLFEVGIGYQFTPELFSTLNYQYTSLDMANIKDVLGTINYQFELSQINAFIGAVFGVSSLTWSDNPTRVLIDKDLTSECNTYGVQVGIKKEIQENLSAIAKYRYLSYDHELDIRKGRASIKHDQGQNIVVGVQYDF